MFKLVSKRELTLYAAQIQELRNEVVQLKTQVDHERRRAEGAINLLLMRTVKAAITPEPTGMSLAEEENMKAKMFDIWGDGQQLSEDEALEKLQS
jgi:hypothetical protein